MGNKIKQSVFWRCVYKLLLTPAPAIECMHGPRPRFPRFKADGYVPPSDELLLQDGNGEGMEVEATTIPAKKAQAHPE